MKGIYYMTCIVGYTNGRNVIIGGDSAGVGGYDFKSRKDSKVFKKGQIIFGGTYSFRMIQILGYSWTPPDISYFKDPMEYMVNDFVPSLFKTFEDNKFLQTDKGRAEGCWILVGVKGRLFNVQGDFQVGETYVPYDSVGCGSDLAMGAMYNLFADNRKYNMNDSKFMLTKALDTATKFSAGVGGPYNFVTV